MSLTHVEQVRPQHDDSLQVGFLLFPKLTQLDLTGPLQVLSIAPGIQTHLVWREKAPVTSDAGLSLLPTTTLEECPDLDVLCVPGGAGQVLLMQDQEILGFLRRQAEHCRYVTAVCTGSLLLGAAGLLDGYQATTHWSAVEQLAAFGAVYKDKRVVKDRDRITGGGVTAGIDFAFTLVAELLGEDVAKMIQLGLEYAPAPPFAAGTPVQAGEALTALVKEMLDASLNAHLSTMVL